MLGNDGFKVKWF